MTTAVSVKDRLKNQAAASGRTMQETLIAYGLERTIYRLSVSEYSERFILKGGIFLYALFEGEFARVTRDIDLLAKSMPNNAQEMRAVFEDIFSIEYDDALRYDLSTLDVKDITEFKEYHGVNVSIIAFLERTEIPVSIDIGFGDVVYPDRVKMDYPVLLDMDIPEVYAYSLYSVIAEKFEAIVSLGDANSRYKDFYDIYVLADRCDLFGEELSEAIRETFAHRETGFDDIIAFDESFAERDIHKDRWNAFQKKKKALDSVTFREVLSLLKALLSPVVDSIQQEESFVYKWDHVNRTWNKCPEFFTGEQVISKDL